MTMKVCLLLLLCAPVSAQIYDYTGATMTGTDTVNIYNTTGGFTTTVTPISEAYSAQFVLSGTSLAYTLDLGGQLVTAGSQPGTGSSWILGPGYAQATYATSGAIDGFDLAINCNGCNGKADYSFNVTPTGDSYYLGWSSGTEFSITGLSNTTAGVWSAAQPVPIPASVWLMLSGLGGLGFLARRRSA
jgi:hypothetical protein